MHAAGMTFGFAFITRTSKTIVVRRGEHTCGGATRFPAGKKIFSCRQPLQSPGFSLGTTGTFPGNHRMTVPVSSFREHERYREFDSPVGTAGGAIKIASPPECKIYRCVTDPNKL